MVSHKKLVSVYLPEELYQALIAYQEQQGFKETSEAIIQILAQFFHKGGEFKRYATVEQLETLEEKVTDLSKQVSQLCQVITSSTSKETPRTAIASSNLGNKPTPPSKTAQQTPISFANTNLEEEEEEEPYEILYDFLEPGSPTP